MTEVWIEPDDAPDWYIDHFVAFGYAAGDLREKWAGLSDSARKNYRWALTSSPASEGGQSDA